MDRSLSGQKVRDRIDRLVDAVSQRLADTEPEEAERLLVAALRDSLPVQVRAVGASAGAEPPTQE